MVVDRKACELLRKRRNNLVRRHDEFAKRYQMKIWLVMIMPNGRLYTYRSNPDEPAPTDAEIVGCATLTHYGILKICCLA